VEELIFLNYVNKKSIKATEKRRTIPINNNAILRKTIRVIKVRAIK
jgi:hypothetical protein